MRSTGWLLAGAIALTATTMPVAAQGRAADSRAPDTLGSGLIGHSQKMTVAARATAEKKTVGQRS